MLSSSVTNRIARDAAADLGSQQTFNQEDLASENQLQARFFLDLSNGNPSGLKQSNTYFEKGVNQAQNEKMFEQPQRPKSSKAVKFNDFKPGQDDDPQVNSERHYQVLDEKMSQINKLKEKAAQLKTESMNNLPMIKLDYNSPLLTFQ